MVCWLSIRLMVAFCLVSFNSIIFSSYGMPALTLLQLNEQFNAVVFANIRIERYVFNSHDFQGIKDIIASRISIDGKEYSYAQLLDADEKTIIERYSKDYVLEPLQERFIIKTVNNKVIGFGQVTPYSHHEGFDILIAKEQSWIVDGMGIAPQYRRFGIGRKLFDHMAQWVEHKAESVGKNATYLYVSCVAFNKPACEAYKKWTDKCKDYGDKIVCKRDLMTDPEFRKTIEKYRSF